MLMQGMYPSLVIVAMDERLSNFSTSTFVFDSQTNLTGNPADLHQSRALSALHFATQHMSSQTQSITGNLQDSSKDGVHTMVTSNAEKVLV